MKTIGIFPASGKLGGSTYRHLLELVPYDHVVLICRHPDKVPAHYTQGGVRVRQASYEDTPAELEAAFAGIDVLFLISFPSFVESYRVRVQVPAVDAARRAGVQHLVYSSLAYGGGPDGHASRAEVMRAHLVTEAHLRAALATGGDTLLLSGTRAWTLAETVDAVFNSQPRKEGEPPVRIRPVSVDEYARLPAVQAVYGAQAGNGRDTRSAYELATGWATAWEAIREGEAAVVTPTLREVLGREPTPPF
ncbi:NAD(P)-binding domain protein [Niveomyces insectorum RCEF 264]|uniref:NAD(P)-binding domain protein n=1 Tax=Niveomyces insectorum RCEF 264 TaxID=1081102 RepID=A0A167WAK1_9HYPO|nr:NAD(P)-binding domain protein [Niveomyces insectorum RCEF 264]